MDNPPLDSDLHSPFEDYSNSQITKLYLSERSTFRNLSKRSVSVSRGSGGIPSVTNQMFWASVLFTRIVVISKSFEKLLPNPKPKEHWDFGSAASISRNLSEAYLWYFWLCEDDVALPVSDGRLILMQLFDHGSRKKIFHPNEFLSENDKVLEDLKSKFFRNPYLKTLPEKRQKVLLKGQKTPFNQDEVLERMNTDKDDFRMMYRWFSQYTHTGPVAFYRMFEGTTRGAGVETRLEKIYYIFAIQFASAILKSAINGHLKMFPNAETRKPWLTDNQVIRNVERDQGR
ncbi:MAG: DUF5677 domain-containing protein [Parasphingorhabdus sp.]|uniref:DUF5677 domain-containing protein n=1 Tax=Parasphingorhabdus sp. TaxID=2709688 RepID=UPI0030038DF5